jgi:amylosucrase
LLHGMIVLMPEMPAPVLSAMKDGLVDADAATQEMFDARLRRWWPDLRDGLAAVYGGHDIAALAARMVGIAARAVAQRPADLRRLDLERTLRPDWFQSPEMLGYACYTERFAGDLAGVREKIPYLKELGVTYLHLMPLLRPREGDSDGGYAVADYRSVRADLGSIDDLRDLADELRANGISLVMDLVLNHVAREHDWAAAARADDPHYRNYFRLFDDRTMPDAYDATVPEVFPDFAPGNFTWDEDLNAWVWTTFNSFQWDMNWENPDVFAEYLDIVLFLANLGVEVVRLDAIAFIWKRLGTSCQNQPEVHWITQALRALAHIACPAVVFKAEAIVGPNDLVHYLGQGRHHGKVSDLAYHNSLMVQTWSMLAAADARLAAHALQAVLPVPATTAWITYVRCHDDIGWAIDDADAAAVGLNGFWHRYFLSDYYSGQFAGSTARGLVFQENPATRDRRISGTTASLTGIEAARQGSDPGALDHAVARALLAHALAMGWGGIPVLWSGDELAMPNDPHWEDEPGHQGDNRWAHRPQLDWDLAQRRHDASTVEGRVFQGMGHLGRVRARLAHLHASVPAQVLDLADPGVLTVLRDHPLGPLLGLYNVTDEYRWFPAHRLGELGIERAHDAISDSPVSISADGNVWLPPYAFRWVVDADSLIDR